MLGMHTELEVLYQIRPVVSNSKDGEIFSPLSGVSNLDFQVNMTILYFSQCNALGPPAHTARMLCHHPQDMGCLLHAFPLAGTTLSLSRYPNQFLTMLECRNFHVCSVTFVYHDPMHAHFSYYFQSEAQSMLASANILKILSTHLNLPMDFFYPH